MMKLLAVGALALMPVPANAPAPAARKIELTGNPIADAPTVCLIQALDKFEQAKAGTKEPQSEVLPTYIEHFKLGTEEQTVLRFSCDLFERGFIAGVLASIEKPKII